jgi:hypothetical protein
VVGEYLNLRPEEIEMTLAEQIYQHSRVLPEEAAQQALAFVAFLAQRYAATLPISTTMTPRQPGSAQGKLQILEEDTAHLAHFQEDLRRS